MKNSYRVGIMSLIVVLAIGSMFSLGVNTAGSGATDVGDSDLPTLEADKENQIGSDQSGEESLKGKKSSMNSDSSNSKINIQEKWMKTKAAITGILEGVEDHALLGNTRGDKVRKALSKIAEEDPLGFQAHSESYFQQALEARNSDTFNKSLLLGEILIAKSNEPVEILKRILEAFENLENKDPFKNEEGELVNPALLPGFLLGQLQDRLDQGAPLDLQSLKALEAPLVNVLLKSSNLNWIAEAIEFLTSVLGKSSEQLQDHAKERNSNLVEIPDSFF